MAALGDHPYIVQVFRAGTSDDGRPYLVMKYYPPPNLAMRARAERFSVEEVLRTGIQLASAVETAHRAHITHRDIKPANVLISAYGAPGLTDFGIAGRGARDGETPPEATDDVGRLGALGAARGALRAEQRRRAGRRLLPRGDPVAAARRALALRGAGWRQLGLRAHAAHPQHAPAAHRSARRAGGARAPPRPGDGQGPRAPTGDARSSSRGRSSRSSRTSASRAPRSSCSTSRATRRSSARPRARRPGAPPTTRTAPGSRHRRRSSPSRSPACGRPAPAPGRRPLRPTSTTRPGAVASRALQGGSRRHRMPSPLTAPTAAGATGGVAELEGDDRADDEPHDSARRARATTTPTGPPCGGRPPSRAEARHAEPRHRPAGGPLVAAVGPVVPRRRRRGAARRRGGAPAATVR